MKYGKLLLLSLFLLFLCACRGGKPPAESTPRQGEGTESPASSAEEIRGCFTADQEKLRELLARGGDRAFFYAAEEDGTAKICVPDEDTDLVKLLKKLKLQYKTLSREEKDGTALGLFADGKNYEYRPSSGVLCLAGENYGGTLPEYERGELNRIIEEGYGTDRYTVRGLRDFREGLRFDRAAECGFLVTDGRSGELLNGLPELERFLRGCEEKKKSTLLLGIKDEDGTVRSVKRISYDKNGYYLDEYQREETGSADGWRFSETVKPRLTVSSTPRENGILTMLFISTDGKATAERYLQREGLDPETGALYSCDGACWADTAVVCSFTGPEYPVLEGLAVKANPTYCPVPWDVWQPCRTCAFGPDASDRDNWSRLPGIRVEDGVLTMYYTGYEQTLNGRWTLFDKLGDDGRIRQEDLFFPAEEGAAPSSEAWEALQEGTAFVWRFEGRAEKETGDYIDYILYFVCERDGGTKLLWVELAPDESSFAKLPRIRGLHEAGELLMQLPAGSYGKAELLACGDTETPRWTAEDFIGLRVEEDGTAVLENRRVKGSLTEKFTLWDTDPDALLRSCISGWNLTDTTVGKFSWLESFSNRSLCVYRGIAGTETASDSEERYLIVAEDDSVYLAHMTGANGALRLQALYRLERS